MKKTAYILLAALGFASCNYLEIDPVGKVIPHKVSEYRALLTTGYYNYSSFSATTYIGILSDEIGSLDQSQFSDSNEGVALSYNLTWQYGSQMRELPYQDCYRSIFYATAVIDEAMDADADTSGESKEQILGEAYAMRAYLHFALVNLYGQPYNPATASTDRGVPISNNIDIEQKYRPANVAAVYTQILEDIEQAENYLTIENYLNLEVTERAKLNYRFTRDALQGLKARVMLYMRNWQEAYDAATALLPKYKLVDFNTTVGTNALPWKATSEEAILAWERPFNGANNDLIYAGLLSDEILGLFDSAADKRSSYIGAAYVYDENWNPTLIGYRPSSRSASDRTSLRIAEMYLIAAEAGSYLTGELDNAKGYLLDLQKMRFSPEGYTAKETAVEAMTAEQFRTEVANDRARELLIEGHRWFDLRRTTQPSITHTSDGQTYTLYQSDSRYTLPFPQSAVNNNPELNN